MQGRLNVTVSESDQSESLAFQKGSEWGKIENICDYEIRFHTDYPLVPLPKKC